MRRYVLRIAAVSVVTWAVATPATAQTERDFQVWNALLATADLPGPSSATPSLWLDVHARRGDAGTVHILRPGVGVRLAPFLSLWAGYGWVPVFTDGGPTAHEHRAWQQVILQHRTDDRLAMQSRTRFEQRFHDGGDDVGLRVRQFVRMGWQPSADIPVGVVGWDELFLGLHDTDWGALGGFDQNRLFLGAFMPITTGVRVEVGYLNVYVRRTGADLLAHNLAINLFVNLKPGPVEEEK
ncbi:MAG: DUF2490 domain-containing protein [Myxococcota bacterium]